MRDQPEDEEEERDAHRAHVALLGLAAALAVQRAAGGKDEDKRQEVGGQTNGRRCQDGDHELAGRRGRASQQSAAGSQIAARAVWRMLSWYQSITRDGVVGAYDPTPDKLRTSELCEQILVWGHSGVVSEAHLRAAAWSHGAVSVCLEPAAPEPARAKANRLLGCLVL